MAASKRRDSEEPNGERCPSCEELAAENQALKERLAEVERAVEQLRRAGKRQSAPFSKGDPEAEPKRPGRNKGKAHGRHGHRAVPSNVDRELEAPLPGCCPDCGADVDFERWDEQFQTELPEVRPTVTRFRVGVGRCRGCKRRVQGRHAEQTSDALGAAASQLGPRAKAWGTWLHYELGLSFNKCSALLARLGIDVTAGAICSSSASTSTALVPTHNAIKAHVAASPALTMDETGWRIAGEGAWLWVAATDAATVYLVARGRDFDAATALVPAHYEGVVIRDGWVVYNSYDKARHQTCVAHLVRRCHEMIEDLPAWARHTPRQVKDLLLEALDARDLDAEGRAAAIVDIGERLDLLAEQAHPHDANRRLVKHLVHERHALFTFLTTDGVDATNWRGEQGIRPAVVNRKVWGGNRTERGAEHQSRLMTFLRTAHQQGADAVA
ncbi:MAG TPA: IS66 family transposase, partial [Acidimicrobiales bacterium]|nr:IS66 family transposase [Acidimicrobiales bacterium]